MAWLRRIRGRSRRERIRNEKTRKELGAEETAIEKIQRRRLTSQVKPSQYHFIANTNSVHKRHINKEVMEFVKGKPKGTNPAIMGNPIDMYAVNGSKKQSILLLENPYLN